MFRRLWWHFQTLSVVFSKLVEHLLLNMWKWPLLEEAVLYLLTDILLWEIVLSEVILEFTSSYINYRRSCSLFGNSLSYRNQSVDSQSKSAVWFQCNYWNIWLWLQFLLEVIFEQTILIWCKFFQHSSEIYQPHLQSFLLLWYRTTVKKISKTAIRYHKGKKPWDEVGYLISRVKIL